MALCSQETCAHFRDRLTPQPTANRLSLSKQASSQSQCGRSFTSGGRRHNAKTRFSGRGRCIPCHLACVLSLHFTAPHWPWEGPQGKAVSDSLTEVMHHDGGTIATYRAMIESLDRNIAAVLRALQKSGKAKNTLVIFTSDNGGERFAKSWPFNGMKGELLEGGIRVPLLVRWPSQVRAGSITQQTAMNMDFLPTLLDIAGVPPDSRRPPDGESLLPTLRDATRVHDRTLFWRYHAHAQGAARRGQYKYLRIENNEFLFDVVADPQERGNLNKRQEAVFLELKDAWARWDATLLPYTQQNATWSNKTQNFLPDRY